MSETLQVKFVDLHEFDNAQKHFTDKFELLSGEIPVAILRRGQKFSITIHFEKRNFIKNKDSARIVFSYGSKPNPIKGTKAIIPFSNHTEDLDNSFYWALSIVEESSEENNFFIKLEVISPPDCPVGKWKLKIETFDFNSTSNGTVYEYDSEIYLLFNPWCIGDQVFMKDTDKLNEYVLNDVGKIWLGPRGFCKGREWIFGQYDADVLPAIMLMLSRSGLADISYGDPIKVTRTISKLVNNGKDNGVLIARWDGEYFDGIPPAAWTGSVDILKRFLKTEKPVGYGQCWVFAGVVTTICRALGIPSRVVSNLISAQDANESQTVDKYYDENNDELNLDSCDSLCENIWNFHVWNDVWMARPDLLTGFDGWQAIDATPTKNSHGFQECGPASLEAIKKRITGLNFDVGFMVASVNADIVHWKKDASYDSGFSIIHCNKNKIGHSILTKRPYCFDPNGGQDKENITYQYKVKEGTELEREYLKNSSIKSGLSQRSFDTPDASMKGLEFLLVQLDRIQIGKSFNIVVKIINTSNKERNLEAVLSARSIFYTGIYAKEIIKSKYSILIQPNEMQTLTLVVHPENYLDKLVEYGIVKFHAICTDLETNTTWVDEDDFQVEKSNIDIQVPEDLEINKESTITLNFKNPLKKMLTNCKFYVASPGLLCNKEVSSDDIEPESQAMAEVIITPSAEGNRQLIATFASNELVDIIGSVELCV